MARRGAEQDSATDDRTAVFVSYQRNDEQFVTSLAPSLEGLGLVVWLDRTDIPAAADWRDQIEDGIEGCQALVAVVSPDSIQSVEVGKEIDRAAELGKRIVPILHRDVDPGDAHEAVASRNWVFWRTEEDAPAALEKIDQALKVDPEWAKEHTRLQGLALVWDRRGRHNSDLARGPGLADAETQIVVDRPPNQPQVTPLMREYFATCRKVATRRTRIVTGVSVGVAVVSITLAVLAIVARFEADRQRAEAVRQRDTATSAALAAQSGNLLEAEPDLAALLALEAYRTKDTVDALGSLLEVVDTATTFIDRFPAHDQPITSTAHHEASGLVATGDEEGRVVLWDLGPEGTATARNDLIETPDRALVAALAFDESGTELTVAMDSAVEVWGVAGDGVSRIASFAFPVVDPVLSPDGTMVAGVGEFDGQLVLQAFELATGEPRGFGLLALDESIEADPTSLVFSPDSAAVAVGFGTEIHVWQWFSSSFAMPLDVEQLASSDADGLSSDISSVTFTSDANHLAFGTAEGPIHLIDIEDPDLVQISEAMPATSSQALSLAFLTATDDDGESTSLLASGHQNGEVKVWVVDEAGAFDLVTLRGHDEEVLAVTLTADGFVASGSYDGDVIWSDIFGDAHIGKVIRDPSLETSHGSDVTDVHFLGPDVLVSVDDDGTLNSWDPETLVPTDGPAGDGVISIGVAGQLLVASYVDGSVSSFDAASDTSTDFSPRHDGLVVAVEVSGDQLLVVTADETGQVWLWDTAGQVVAEAAVPDGFQPIVATFPSREVLWVGGEITTPADESFAAAVRIDTSTGEVIDQIRHNNETGHFVLSLAVSPDGTTLATGGSDRRIRLWDTTDLSEETAVLASHLDNVTDVVFVTDDVMFASDEDTRILMWDVDAGRTVGGLTGPSDGVTSLTLHPDGTSLVAGSEDDLVWSWDLDLESWLEGACTLAGRNMTVAEWARFRLEGDPVAHCPQFGDGDRPPAAYRTTTG